MQPGVLWYEENLFHNGRDCDLSDHGRAMGTVPGGSRKGLVPALLFSFRNSSVLPWVWFDPSSVSIAAW